MRRTGSVIKNSSDKNTVVRKPYHNPMHIFYKQILIFTAGMNTKLFIAEPFHSGKTVSADIGIYGVYRTRILLKLFYGIINAVIHFSARRNKTAVIFR